MPADAILGLIVEHRDDPRPEKVDLGVGVYRTAKVCTVVDEVTINDLGFGIVTEVNTATLCGNVLLERAVFKYWCRTGFECRSTTVTYE